MTDNEDEEGPDYFKLGLVFAGGILILSFGITYAIQKVIEIYS